MIVVEIGLCPWFAHAMLGGGTVYKQRYMKDKLLPM